MKNVKWQHIRKTIGNINNDRFMVDKARIQKLFKFPKTALMILDVFSQEPEQTVADLVKKVNVSRQNVTGTINKLVKNGFVSPVDPERQWGQRYRYNNHVGFSEDFSCNRTNTHNANGVFLQFQGRNTAEKLVTTPASEKFKPDKEHNSLPNNAKSKNKVYIGDNLDVMKTILPDYRNGFDLIYLDILYGMPSTRRPQAYADGFDGSCEFLRTYYPRLQLCKQLLRDDGIIAISISHHQLAYLKIMMDEIFGPEQHVSLVTVITSVNAGPVVGYSEYRLPECASYLVMYARDKSKARNFSRLYETASTYYTSGFNWVIECEDPAKPLYKKTSLIDFLKSQDKVCKLFRKHNLPVTLSNISLLADMDADFETWLYNDLAPKLYKVTKPKSNPLKSVLNAPIGTIISHNGSLYEKQSNGAVSHYIRFFDKLIKNDDGTIENGYIVGTVWDIRDQKSVVQHEGGVTFHAGKKPTKLIRMILKFLNRPNAIVGDFVAGSGSTAHAVMLQNSYDGGARSYLLAQTNEKIQPGTAEAKAGFKTIPQLLLTRLRNAAHETGNKDGWQLYK